MSCPFTDKLPAEIRAQIYQYVLTFDAPLRHVTEMRPFAERALARGNLTRPEKILKMKLYARRVLNAAGSKLSLQAGSAVEAVHTDLLVVNKSIYREAIAVFYQVNTIMLARRFLKIKNILRARPTDLSLAGSVLTRIETMQDPLTQSKKRTSKPDFCVALKGIQETFPWLRCGTVYVWTDSTSRPMLLLYVLKMLFDRSRNFEDCRFDGVGSVVASLSDSPIKIKAQYKAAIDHWNSCANDLLPQAFFTATTLSANALSRFLMKHQERELAVRTLEGIHSRLRQRLPQEYPEVPPLSFELWTFLECALHRELLRRAKL